MTDYKELGFKCGLEIHQQIEGKKLFCNCPTSNLRTGKPDIVVERKLRAVAGETGKVDIAAQHEMAKGKRFIYEGDSKDVCLVEIDEEPPRPINKETIQVALQVAKMLNMKLVDEIQIMRKTVVDGSNVTGFQRTSLVGYNGYIETSQGNVEIESLCLEEEACQKIEANEEFTKYRLDRLGIPLLEIATAPGIKSPEHAKEAAEKIGMIIRSTGKCKRGIVTIRQDVNVSIKGGVRVEIKGFQDLKTIPNVIENEVKRQQDEIKKGTKLQKEVRKAEPDGSTTFLRPMPGSARMYPETDVLPFKVDAKDIKTSELIEDKAKRYEEIGLNKDFAKLMSKSDKAEMFDRFVKEFDKVKPAFIADTLISSIRDIRRKYEADVDKITEKEFEEIFKALNENIISKNVVMDILIDHAHGKFKNFDKYKAEGAENLEEEITKIVKENPGLREGAYMGMVMKKFQGKVDGKATMEILKKLLN